MISVDLKTFIRIEVETDDPVQAEAEARRFLDGLNASQEFIDGWNTTQLKEAGPLISDVGAFDQDEDAYVENDEGDEIKVL